MQTKSAIFPEGSELLRFQDYHLAEGCWQDVLPSLASPGEGLLLLSRH